MFTGFRSRSHTHGIDIVRFSGHSERFVIDLFLKHGMHTYSHTNQHHSNTLLLILSHIKQTVKLTHTETVKHPAMTRTVNLALHVRIQSTGISH